ncbi:hypothetical protein [Marinobacter gelidimuriae]|uniref:hypothetical protein n=1 Tax=Marinobacter gelidimuriae TaxID=2739064 RepID=UPI00037605C1|nr:hypothetical protein [Marinobacter gelidimuriae]
MTNHFESLEKKLPELKAVASELGPNAFYAQEAIRFRSMVGTLKAITFKLDTSAEVDERHITHVLSRSLLENYFWLLYIFDDDNKKGDRYGELINSFKKDYLKLTNEPMLPHKDKLETADASWATLPNALNVNSMLAQVKNDRGERLDYLYFIYRITSFDTHGKNLATIGQSTFGKIANFPILDLKAVFDLIANHYLVIFEKLRNAGEI